MRNHNRALIGICVALLVVTASFLAEAQVSAGIRRESEPVVEIRKLDGLGPRGKVKTPEYNNNFGGSVRRARDWTQIMTTYRTIPDWIDEITFTYYALGYTEKNREKEYSLYKKVVRYIDIPNERFDHKSTVYLHPNVTERYGELVGIAVEISHKGEIVAVEHDEDPGAKLPEDWWTNPKVVESELVTIRDGYLKNREESPFALINIEDYEVIK